MKALLVFLTVLLPSLAFSYQCQDFAKDAKKMETLEFIAKNFYKYSSAAEFCEKDTHMDLELYFIPNYFKFQEEDDDHYKMMIHYSDRSCTVIYNITQKFITDKSCYSTW